MKTQSILRLLLSCPAILIAGNSFAQNSANYAFSNTTVNASKATTIIKRTGNISIRAQRSFVNYFKNTSNESWSKINNNYYVNFITDGKKKRAMLTESGDLIYTILYGLEKDLPGDVRKQIKGTYYDYNIITAIQVQEDKRTIWVVQMEDDKKNLTIRVEDGEMEEVQQFTKS